MSIYIYRLERAVVDMTEAEQRRREVCIPVGERIRHFREEARMTKEGLAEAADISTQYVRG